MTLPVLRVRISSSQVSCATSSATLFLMCRYQQRHTFWSSDAMTSMVAPNFSSYQVRIVHTKRSPNFKALVPGSFSFCSAVRMGFCGQQPKAKAKLHFNSTFSQSPGILLVGLCIQLEAASGVWDKTCDVHRCVSCGNLIVLCVLLKPIHLVCFYAQ